MTECVRGSVKMFETDKVAEKHSENSSSVGVWYLKVWRHTDEWECELDDLKNQEQILTGMLQWRDKSEGKCTNLLLGWFIKLNLTVIGHIHLHSCVNQHKKVIIFSSIMYVRIDCHFLFCKHYAQGHWKRVSKPGKKLNKNYKNI